MKKSTKKVKQLKKRVKFLEKRMFNLETAVLTCDCDCCSDDKNLSDAPDTEPVIAEKEEQA